MEAKNTATETQKRPGLAFLGWAMVTAATATTTYFFIRDVEHLNATILSPNLSNYVDSHLALIQLEEVIGALVSGGAGLSSGIKSLKSLYRVAERHFDNKRLAQPNA